MRKTRPRRSCRRAIKKEAHSRPARRRSPSRPTCSRTRSRRTRYSRTSCCCSASRRTTCARLRSGPRDGSTSPLRCTRFQELRPEAARPAAAPRRPPRRPRRPPRRRRCRCRAVVRWSGGRVCRDRRPRRSRSRRRRFGPSRPDSTRNRAASCRSTVSPLRRAIRATVSRRLPLNSGVGLRAVRAGRHAPASSPQTQLHRPIRPHHRPNRSSRSIALRKRDAPLRSRAPPPRANSDRAASRS